MRKSDCSGLTCLGKAANFLGIPHDSQSSQIDIDGLEALERCARAQGMQTMRMEDWPDVDSALAQRYPVVLVGDPMAQQAHGKRLGMSTGGMKFLLLNERVSTTFPTTGGPFATETVSYLSHDPHYADNPVWLCLGELRGYCDAANEEGALGVALLSE